MAYRIGLTGAQGTGKSTLAQAICASLRASGVTDVQAFLGLGLRLSRTGVAMGSHGNRETVREFARAHLEREAAGAGAIQVFDRCLLDTLAYAKVLDCLPCEEFAALSVATVASCTRFQELIWLRVTHDYPVLSEGDETPEFRRAVDAAIGDAAHEHGIALVHYSLPDDALELVCDDIVRRAGRR